MKIRKNSDHEKCHFAAEEMMEVGSLRRQRPRDRETEGDKKGTTEAYTHSRH